MPPIDTSTGMPAAAEDPPRFSEDVDSACSTPFVSAPSSPVNSPPGYFFSAPASPMHFLLSSEKKKAALASYEPVFLSSDSDSFEFEFSSRVSANGSWGNGIMTSADELFFNGQIRPMKLSSHLMRSQDIVADLDGEYGEEASNTRGRDTRVRGAKQLNHRKTRSLSPLREWNGLRTIFPSRDRTEGEREVPSSETTPSSSASSSRSSSSGRNSKKWMFLKEFIRRSKSEGRDSTKQSFWSGISLHPVKNRTNPTSSRDSKKSKSDAKRGSKLTAAGKPEKGMWRRRAPSSAHELHYTINRAQLEEMKKRTFLPYRQGLLGCLGFNSKSYGAFSGFAKNLNPISSR